eukprot:RCo027156
MSLSVFKFPTLGVPPTTSPPQIVQTADPQLENLSATTGVTPTCGLASPILPVGGAVGAVVGSVTPPGRNSGSPVGGDVGGGFAMQSRREHCTCSPELVAPMGSAGLSSSVAAVTFPGPFTPRRKESPLQPPQGLQAQLSAPDTLVGTPPPRREVAFATPANCANTQLNALHAEVAQMRAELDAIKDALDGGVPSPVHRVSGDPTARAAASPMRGALSGPNRLLASLEPATEISPASSTVVGVSVGCAGGGGCPPQQMEQMTELVRGMMIPLGRKLGALTRAVTKSAEEQSRQLAAMRAFVEELTDPRRSPHIIPPRRRSAGFPISSAHGPSTF